MIQRPPAIPTPYQQQGLVRRAQSALPTLVRALPTVGRSLAVVVAGAGIELVRRRITSGSWLPWKRPQTTIVEEVIVYRRTTTR